MRIALAEIKKPHNLKRFVFRVFQADMRTMAAINNRMGVGAGGRFFLVGFAKMEAIEISEVAYLEIEVLPEGCSSLRF